MNEREILEKLIKDGEDAKAKLKALDKPKLKDGNYGIGKNMFGEHKCRLVNTNLEIYNENGVCVTNQQTDKNIWLGNIFDDLEAMKDSKAMIADAEKRLTDLEVTYSIGDRFKDKDGNKFILLATDTNVATLGELESGWAGEKRHRINTRNFWVITEKEMGSVIEGLTRYWDNNQ